MKKPHSIEEAVIYSSRMEIREVIRKQLTLLKFSEVKMFGDSEDFLESAKESPNCVFVVDANEDNQKIREVFETIKQHHMAEFGPFIILARKPDRLVTGLCLEYEVARLLRGNFSSDEFKNTVESLLVIEEEQRPLREAMKEILSLRNNLNNWKKSRELLQNLLTEHAQNQRIRVELAANLYQEEQYDEAMKVLQPILNASPHNPRAHHLYGRCALKKGEVNGALKAFQSAQMLNPDNLERLLQVGDILMQTGKFPEAKQNFKDAKSLDPNSKQADLGVGECMLLEGDVNESIELLKGVTNLNEMISVFNSAAILALKLKKAPDGIKLYDKALELSGNNTYLQSRIYFNKALGFYCIQIVEKTFENLEKAIEADPTFEKAARSYETFSEKHKRPMKPAIVALIEKGKAMRQEAENKDMAKTDLLTPKLDD